MRTFFAVPGLALLVCMLVAWMTPPPKHDVLKDTVNDAAVIAEGAYDVADIAQVQATPQHRACSCSRGPDERNGSDRWYPVLAELVDHLADSYAERSEPAVRRGLRLATFTTGVLEAVDSNGFLWDDEMRWLYANALVWVAHRETRIMADPNLIGDQDHHKAAGPWQIWDVGDWKGRDRWSAVTALDIMIRDPGAWSLPGNGAPWTGYPECDAWIRSHPRPIPRFD